MIREARREAARLDEECSADRCSLVVHIDSGVIEGSETHI